MKTAQEPLTEFDRLSTHEELHQVLALLDECVSGADTAAPGETEDRRALREAVMDLWQDAAAGEHEGYDETGLRSEVLPWAGVVANKSDRIN